jgi:hypothetical protein
MPALAYRMECGDICVHVTLYLTSICDHGSVSVVWSPVIKCQRGSIVFLSFLPSPPRIHPSFPAVVSFSGAAWDVPVTSLKTQSQSPARQAQGLYLEDSVDPVFFKCCKHVYGGIFSFLQTLVNFQVGKSDAAVCHLYLRSQHCVNGSDFQGLWHI